MKSMRAWVAWAIAAVLLAPSLSVAKTNPADSVMQPTEQRQCMDQNKAISGTAVRLAAPWDPAGSPQMFTVVSVAPFGDASVQGVRKAPATALFGAKDAAILASLPSWWSWCHWFKRAC